MPTVSEVASQVLKDAGIGHIFGYPGGEVTSFIDQARKAGIEFILTKHETPAAFMAGAYGEITGRPGVCMSTLGPGAANMVCGILDAYLDRAPLLALTGQMPERMQNIATHQRLETSRMMTPLTKWQATLNPGSVSSTLRKAIKIALAPRPGPVHLEIASDVANMDNKPEPVASWDPTEPVIYPEFTPAQVTRAAKLVNASKQPALLVGLGAVLAGAQHDVIRLAEHLGCPVLVAPKAKGIMPEDHQLFSGVIEMLGHDVPVSLIRKADLLLAIGFDPVELDKPWLFDAPVVHIDQVPNTDGYYAASCEVVGDVRSALRALVGSLLPRGSWQWALEDIRASRHELLGLVTRKVSGLAGHDVVRTARQMLPADAIATCDVGAHKFMVGQLWTTYTPRTFFMSNGLSSMGYGFLTALTAKLLFPETPVIGFLGDGGMSMYLGEIETAVRLGVPLITVVLCDESLSLIKMNQERKGIPYTGVEFGNPDYAEIARCFGASGFRVQSQSEMQQALAEAMTSQKPVFIHADIDASAYRI